MIALLATLSGFVQYGEIKGNVSERFDGSNALSYNVINSGEHGMGWTVESDFTSAVLSLGATFTVSKTKLSGRIDRSGGFHYSVRAVAFSDTMPGGIRGEGYIRGATSASAWIGMVGAKGSGSAVSYGAKSSARAPKGTSVDDESQTAGQWRHVYYKVRGPWLHDAGTGQWYSEWVQFRTEPVSANGKASAPMVGGGATGGGGTTSIQLLTGNSVETTSHQGVTLNGIAERSLGGAEIVGYVFDAAGNLLTRNEIGPEDPANENHWSVYLDPQTTGPVTVKLVRQFYLTKAIPVTLDGGEDLDLWPTYQPIFGDLNGDNLIDAEDLKVATAYRGKTADDWDTIKGWDPLLLDVLDANHDGMVQDSELDVIRNRQGLSGD